MTSRFAAGQLLGRYRIVRPLGSGAMGDVYLAEDPQIERKLALKTVRVVDGRPAEVEDRKRRLLREAKAAGKLIHPNVVTLFDAGEADGVLYLAFEFVDGSDLAHRLESKPALPLRDVLRITREAAEALDFAHQHGIVHRDIKPSNILLDQRGRVKVADFGIARMAGQSTELTMAGSVVGSPQYLSPEQVRGEDLDGRSDIFSLGVVLYELIGHRRPFDGDTLTTLVYQILHQEPKPLPALVPGLGLHLEPLLERFMAKDRESRFATAGEAAEAIRSLETSLAPELLDAPPSAEPADPDATFLLASSRPRSGAPPSATAARRAADSASQPTALLAASATTPKPAHPTPGRSRTGPLLLVAVGLLVLIGAGLGAWNLFGKKLLRAKAPAGIEVPGDSQPDRQPASREVPADSQDPAVVPPPTLPATPPPRQEPVRSEPVPTEPVTPSRSGPARAPAAVPEPPATSPARPSPPATEPQRQRPEPRPEPTPEPEVVEPSVPKPAVDREMRTGLSLTFQVKPEDAFLRLRAIDEERSTPIGQASDYTGKGREGRSYRLPGPGSFVLSLRKEGLDNYDILLHAEEGRGQTAVVADLSARAGTAQGAVAVREGVVLRGEPDTARVTVDGVDRGMVRDFTGGIAGRKILTLTPGLRRVEISAPGLGSRVFEVQVSPAAAKERETLRFQLP